MSTLEVLDVTVIEPRLKHSTIFKYFDELEPGEEFVIHNDHDPKPLYYQLLAERGKTFTWKYVLEGPEFWGVKIGKLSPENANETIGEIVSKDFRKAEVFKRYGIDFCCGGKKTLEKVCATKGLDVAELREELKKAEVKPVSGEQNYNEWSLPFLCDYIVNTHHQYVKGAMPVIYEYTQKVAKVHGDHHPEAKEIAALFVEIMNEMTAHMEKEERVLFPYIKKLAELNAANDFIHAPFGTVRNPIRMMETEHDVVGELVEKINHLSSGYCPPENACATFRVSYAKLKEFEDDLHQHIHLENNILFPAAIKLEEEII